jgi:hypothetical protein
MPTNVPPESWAKAFCAVLSCMSAFLAALSVLCL